MTTPQANDETNVLLYAVIGLIIVAIIGGLLVIRNRSSAKPNNSAISTVANPVMPLPVMPLAPLSQLYYSNGPMQTAILGGKYPIKQ